VEQVDAARLGDADDGQANGEGEGEHDAHHRVALDPAVALHIGNRQPGQDGGGQRPPEDPDVAGGQPPDRDAGEDGVDTVSPSSAWWRTTSRQDRTADDRPTIAAASIALRMNS
jgi:hypothetical protein